MFLDTLKKHRKLWAAASIGLLAYTCLSCFAGFPIGLGTVIARSHVRQYCKAIYPDAAFGKSGYNIVSDSFYTGVFVDGEMIDIDIPRGSAAVNDRSREEDVFEELGVSEAVSRLSRQLRMDHSFIYFHMAWPYKDPDAPITTLRIDCTGGHSSEALPSEREMKQLLFPIVSRCYEELDAVVDVSRIRISYYHPDFNPGEVGMTWQIMQINLEDGASFALDLLLNAEVTTN